MAGRKNLSPVRCVHLRGVVRAEVCVLGAGGQISGISVVMEACHVPGGYARVTRRRGSCLRDVTVCQPR